MFNDCTNSSRLCAHVLRKNTYAILFVDVLMRAEIINARKFVIVETVENALLQVTDNVTVVRRHSRSTHVTTGRASCRERGCQCVSTSVVAVSSKKQETH